MRQRSPAAARRVFVDTAAYFALADPKDANHEAAHALIRRFGTERWQLFTTDFILAETHALVLARRGRLLAARVLEQIDESTTTILPATSTDRRRAR